MSTRLDFSKIFEWQSQFAANKCIFNIVGRLKDCTAQKDLREGSRLHASIQKHEFLEKNSYVANTLVSMYAKCGALPKARQVLDELPVRNAVMWNALISGYAQQGQGEEALKCFDSMQNEGHSPNVVTFTCALKACGDIKAAAKGEEIHDKVSKLGMLEKDVLLGSTMVDMYAKCGALVKAQQLLEELPVHDVVMWSALIAGYVQQGQGEEALKCYDIMEHEGHSPDVVTFVYALKACGSMGVAVRAEQIYEKIVNLGLLEKNIMLGSSVVDMFAKCNALAKAQGVLEGLSVRDVVTWNALITGYVQQEQGEETLKCFDSMQHEGIIPNAVTFMCALKACGRLETSVKGEKVHDKIVSLGMLEKNILLGSTLVDMYARCGELAKAQQVFDKLPVRDMGTWNTLIAGYAQQGQGGEALKCFDRMQQEGHIPDAVTFICVLKACGNVGADVKGEQINKEIVSLDILRKNIGLGNALLNMYAKCGSLAKALQLLEELFVRNVVTWSALITGFVQQRQEGKALKCFDSMQQEGHSLDAVICTCALQACGSIGAAVKGEQIHDKIINLGMLEKNIVLGTALVDMYSKCGALAKAQQVLEELSVQDVATWNALISGYAQQGQWEESLMFFGSMQREGHSPDAVTFSLALRAYGTIAVTAKGEQIHDQIVSLGMLDKNVVLKSSLVDMYAKCGALAKARRLLEELPFRDVVTWSALIAGHVQQGQGEEALKCYDIMQYDGHVPDAITFTCVLKACGSLGAATKVEEIHEKIVNLSILKEDIVLWNTLVDAYAKCGAIAKAQQVVEKLPVRDVVTWSALIGGFAQQGQSLQAINYFEKMQFNGVKPNSSTLISVLYACSHSGLLGWAEMLFSKILIEYGITPAEEHYCCMVDLFGRAGKFSKALMVLEKMPTVECVPTWVALLGACRMWEQVEVGRLAFEHAHHLDKSNGPIYVLMTDIYTAIGLEVEKSKVEVMSYLVY